MKNPFQSGIFSSRLTIAVVLLVAGIVVGIQSDAVKGYNNYLIFISAFDHLIHWEDLYNNYPAEHNDLYLYTPGFALFMAPFYAMPKWLGLIGWSLLSCGFFYAAVISLPGMRISKKTTLFFIVIIEFITCIQNNQTNAIIVSCMVLSFFCLENKKIFWAAFFIVFGSSIKVFGLAAAILILFYPGKGKFILSMIFWTILIGMLPLLFVPFKQLIWQYLNWIYELLSIHKSMDHGVPHNYHPPLSVMGWLKTWFNVNIPGAYFQVGGIVLLMLAFLRTKLYHSLKFRYFVLSSIIIFTVIFNHIAESPTFVIAVFGAAIWFAWEEKNALTWTLLILMLIFTVLSPTDIFPRTIREEYVIPYVLKAVPCILIWFYIQFRIWFGEFEVMQKMNIDN